MSFKIYPSAGLSSRSNPIKDDNTVPINLEIQGDSTRRFAIFHFHDVALIGRVQVVVDSGSVDIDILSSAGVFGSDDGSIATEDLKFFSEEVEPVVGEAAGIDESLQDLICQTLAVGFTASAPATVRLVVTAAK